MLREGLALFVVENNKMEKEKENVKEWARGSNNWNPIASTGMLGCFTDPKLLRRISIHIRPAKWWEIQ